MPNIPEIKIGSTTYELKDAKLRRDMDSIIDAFVHGRNYFNYKTAESGYVLKVDGSKSIVATGFTSDYIEVEPSTAYIKRYVFNSGSIADVVFYDSSKVYISAFYHSGSTRTFTTPSNCSYIRICGYTSDLNSEVVEKGTTFNGHEYYRSLLSPSAGGGDNVYLYAQSGLVYDQTNKQIKPIIVKSNSRIYLHIPGLRDIEFTPPINVEGNGSFLYYNRSTNEFVASNSFVLSEKNVYKVGLVYSSKTNGTFSPFLHDFFIVSGDPVLLYDYVNSVLTVNIKSSTYLWCDKTYDALTVETYDCPILPDRINCIYFNISTRKFVVSNVFSDYSTNPEVVPIGYICDSTVCLSVPYAIKSGTRSQAGKTAVTYGDSLTWYNGHEFTWGPHQGEICHGYQDYLVHSLGIVCTNKGASGSTTPQFVENQILTDGETIRNKDYVIIMPSIMNDDRLNVSPGTPQPIGGTFDTTTTAGSLQTAIEYIYSVKPEARIVIIVEPMGFTYRDGSPKMCNELLPIAIRNVAKLYGLPCIDLWEKSGINALTRNTYYADPTFESGNVNYMYHPNNFGWEVISRIICEEMKAY